MHQRRIDGLTASAGVRLRVNKSVNSAALWALRFRKDFNSFFFVLVWVEFS